MPLSAPVSSGRLFWLLGQIRIALRPRASSGPVPRADFKEVVPEGVVRMLRMVIVKRVLLLLALAAGLIAAADTEAAPKAKGKLKPRRGHPIYLHADSAFAPSEVNRVLIVAFVNTTTAADAVDKFFPLLEKTLRDRPQYVIVPPSQVAAEAERKGAKEDYQALVRQWGDRQFVPDTVQRFATALSASLIMGAEISEWQTEQVAWNVEGYSHSDVEVHLKLYSGKTGALAWDARDKVELKSSHHDPQASGGVVDDLGIQRGKGQIVPPAPPIDDAAKQVAENLVGSLP